MAILVDTSVWSLALRLDVVADAPEVRALHDAVTSDNVIVTTGLVLQELLQGFSGPKDRDLIVQRLSAIPMLQSDREDHIGAADLRNECRRHGVQLGTIDALLAQLCIRHTLTLLTTDKDFQHAANHVPLAVWPNRKPSNPF